MTVTWDQLNRSLHTTLSGGNLTVTGSINRRVGVAVDIPNKLVWFRNAQTNRWNASNTANPATGIGGIAFTPASGLFPMASMDPGGAAVTITGAFAAASMVWAIPSGFSAWDTLVGSATTWNPSDKNAGITLSNGNLTGSNTASGTYIGVRATNSLSSGKAYYEFNLDVFNSAASFSVTGIGTSGASLSSYVGSTPAVSFGLHDNGTIFGGTGSGDSSDWATGNLFYSSILATQSRSSGKYYFEVTIGAVGTDQNPHIGICDGDISIFATSPGLTTHGYTANYENTGAGNVYYNNAVVHSTDVANHVGKAFGIAVDFGAKLIWFWSNDGVNRWNQSGTANPATGTGGFDITALLGVSATQYPVITPHDHDSSLSTTANFGATAFVNVLPSGFSSWDGSQIPSLYLVASFTPGALRADFSGCVGFQFVAGANLHITQLGMIGGNGTTGARNVYLVGGGVVLAQASINLTGIAQGTWVYGSITPVTLTAGNTYGLLVATVNDGTQKWGDAGALTLTNGSGVISSYTTANPPTGALSTSVINQQFFGADAVYDPLTPGVLTLSAQYAEVITSGNAQMVFSTQYAEIITSGSNPQTRLTAQYVEVIAAINPVFPSAGKAAALMIGV